MQGAYIGHDTFTLHTDACYHRFNDIDKDAGLGVLSVIIVSNERIHEKNITVSCNMK